LSSTSTANRAESKPATGGDADSGALQAVADAKKKRVDELYEGVGEQIPKETFPKRKTKDRVSLTCPADKKQGDSILFSNPHVPGQRLKCQIPKNTQPGGAFKVTVPVKEEIDVSTDYNKLSRDFHELLDEYARTYDDWCDALGAYRKSLDGNDCSAHFMKRAKFDDLVGKFPKDLKTPVDKAYLQKILRRARQNRSKREHAAKLKVEKGGGGGDGGSDAPPQSPAPSTGSNKGEEKVSSSSAPGPAKAKPAAARRPSSPSAAAGSEPPASHGEAAALAAKKKPAAKKAAPAPSQKPDAPRTKPIGVPALFREFMSKRFNDSDF
jgi:hypothetical protein